MTESLKNLTIRPEASATDAPAGDLLSLVLAQIRLTGEHVFSVDLAADGAVALSPDAGHVCLVTSGTAQLTHDGDALAALGTGDLLLLPHRMAGLAVVAGEAATVVASRFRFDPESLRAMVTALPTHIHIRRDEGQGWVDQIAEIMLIEAKDRQPGAALMVSRLIDLVIIRALRTWVHRGQTSGWMGGLSDDRIARALMAIHESPTRKWSLEALAALAGMSRSSFSERFTALVGQSPLRYHNDWRLTLARDLLAGRKARVGEVGLSIGYESEAAFSRAYKARFGHSPRAGQGGASL